MEISTSLNRALALAVFALTGLGCDYDDSEFGRPDGEDDRIVGGQNTNIKAVPWQVSIQTNSGFHFCGGSIIDEEWVLTAAHCMTNGSGKPNSTSNMRIKAGVTNKNAAGQLRSVANLYVKPGYNGDPSKGNDVALLRLSSPLDLSGPNAAAIKLAGAGDAAPGKIGLVSGWGTLSSNGSSPNVLQSVQVPIISNANANTAYAAYGGVTSDQIAAGIIGQGGKDSCQGDSGGPFVVGGNRLAGVVSWGVGCADKKYPGMYARVSSFTGWIENTTGGLGGGGNGDDGANAGASCEGNCGVYDQTSECQCDAQCAQYNDCCADKGDVC